LAVTVDIAVVADTAAAAVDIAVIPCAATLVTLSYSGAPPAA
jgi:hypothetical protein